MGSVHWIGSDRGVGGMVTWLLKSRICKNARNSSATKDKGEIRKEGADACVKKGVRVNCEGGRGGIFLQIITDRRPGRGGDTHISYLFLIAQSRRSKPPKNRTNMKTKNSK